jgi:hypothetical protein
LPNILCSHICNHIVLQWINGCKTHTIINNMQLLLWLYMPCGFFSNWLFFSTCPKQMQGLQSHVSIEVLFFVTKIVIIYFQISFGHQFPFNFYISLKGKNININTCEHVIISYKLDLFGNLWFGIRKYHEHKLVRKIKTQMIGKN